MALPHFETWLRGSSVVGIVCEVTEFFPREGMNALFYDEIEKLHARQPMTQAELKQLMAMDFVGYIDRSLRNAGFRDPELDPLVHDIIVKLVATGSLFRNVTGPLLGRFAVSVRNSIITLTTRRGRSRRRHSDYELETLQQRSMPEDDVVERFRSFVRENLGEVALKVLDHRLDGGDTHELRGQPGLESHYALKEMVKRIKRAVRRFGEADPDLSEKIQAALAAQSQTLGKRFARSQS